MLSVKKRDGSIDEFNLRKIESTIKKAFISVNRVYTDDIIELISLRVMANLGEKIKDNTISVADIQDTVEITLIQANYTDVAKDYILYRKNRDNILRAQETVLDYKNTVDNYLNINDWRVKENSTVTYSVGGLILSNSGAITANYWLSEVYDKEIGDAHRNCDIHIHDLSMLTGYCAGWSLKQLIQEGLGGVPGKITSSPASHLSTLCNQMTNFLGIMQNEWAGAQAFSSFDTYLAPFVKKDNLTYKEVKQCIQSFVYGVNTPSRWGTQAPFTNITLDWTVPNDLSELPAIVGGVEQDFKYKDCQKEMDMVNKAFIEIMIEGDANGRGFQYPIPTYSITRDFDWSETENNRLLFEMTAKYGTPYFSNYINSDMEPSDVRSMAILGTQNLIYKDKFGRISKNEVRHLVNNWIKDPSRKYQILMNGKFVDVIDMFKVPYENYDKYVKIQLDNGQSQSFSYDHKCVVVRDNKIIDCLAQDVKTTDKLLLARHGYNESSIGTYESGKIIGYYLAEGWITHNNVEVNFAINDKRKDICEEIKAFFEKNFASRVSVILDVDKHCHKVKVFGAGAVMFVKQFISNDKAIEKRIECRTYDTSFEFRKGVYDGYLATDGSEKCKIFAHTTNKKLCEDMIALFATIGKYFEYQIDEKNTRYFKADKSDLEHFTSYKLKIGDPQIYNDDYYIVGVSNVELLDARNIDTVYNFTVNTPEHIYELPNGIITHQCCRLRLDLRELRKKSGGFFGSGESTGSVGVVTINMPKLAYLSNNEDEFFDKLERMMNIAARSLKIKRNVITRLLDAGLYPYTKRYLGTFNNHFSTIGLVGMNECCLNAKWLRKDLTNKEAQDFTKKTLNFMRNKLSDYQEQYGDLYNLEATPAESTSYRLAKHDKKDFPDIITASGNDKVPYYTNSSHLPVGYTDDIFSALDIQDELQTLYTSGTVFHAFLGQKMPSWQATANLVRKIAENYKLPYYTISPTYSVCAKHGYITGEVYTCPVCGEKTEVYSRITGYYRPVQNWNDGKAEEFRERKVYDVNTSVLKKKEEAISNGKIRCSCEEENEAEFNKFDEKLVLFATKTCPNCKMSKMMLDKAGIKYQVIDAEEKVDLTKQYHIKKAPTLLVFKDNENYDVYDNASEVKRYIESRK